MWIETLMFSEGNITSDVNWNIDFSEGNWGQDTLHTKS